MAERREQEKPLAPASHSHLIVIDKRSPFAAELSSRRRQRCLKCCGCSTALLLILAVTLLILMITVFHVKDPTLKLNSVKIDGLDLLSNQTNFMQGNGLNFTLVAEISIKNPNAASFEFDEATTDVFYNGSVVGEVRTPAGEAKARRTRRMDVLIDVMVDRMVGVSRFESDFNEENFLLSTATRVKGVVNIGDVVKKSIVLKINCAVNVNLESQAVQDRGCNRVVSF